MITPLQTQFIRSNGQPLNIDGYTVIQMDRIPIKQGAITIRFISSEATKLQGVALKSPKGFIKLSDGSHARRVNVWYERDLPSSVRHEITCPDGELRVWNIYKVTTDEDRTRSEAWTNNAGMVVEDVSAAKRRYRCSDGLGDFSLADLTFEIEIDRDAEKSQSEGVEGVSP